MKGDGSSDAVELSGQQLQLETKAGSSALQATRLGDSSDKRSMQRGSSSAPSSAAEVDAKRDANVPVSHRSVDALRQSPLVETHRSSSGRNLRLKQLSLADGALLSAPNALTPRAPSGRRPDGRQRLFSTDSTDNNSPSHDDSSLRRRSSFSISAHVLKELERVRSVTDPVGLAEMCEKPEHHDKGYDTDEHQQRDGSSDESEDVHWDAHDDNEPNNAESSAAHPAAVDTEEKGVPSFGLWNKASKSKRMPDAIIFSGSARDEVKEPAKRSMFNSPRAGEPVQTRKSASLQPQSQSVEAERVAEVNSKHPHLAALSALDIPTSLSLTKSTSPRIGRFTSSSLPEISSRRTARVATNNQQHEVDVVAEVSNPITQWKRGELIGEGTFGKVYKGLNIVTGELFALKEIEIHSSPNADQVTQMQKLGEEIALMNNLSHKHIVRYKGSCRSDNHFYIFMEYVPGGSIASMLQQFDAFSEDLIRIFTRQIVQGVIYLHRMGIIHRDIKGANVLVNEQGVSKLADFGCSKQIPQLLTTSLEESLRSIRGSIPWMAPEVVKQTGHGYKADIWSIGATVIEMATAKHPWPECHNGLAAMYTIAMATSAPPLPAHLSPEAKSFLRRCFCINPEERATALELAAHEFLALR